jgi:hypothetical protein
MRVIPRDAISGKGIIKYIANQLMVKYKQRPIHYNILYYIGVDSPRHTDK